MATLTLFSNFVPSHPVTILQYFTIPHTIHMDLSGFQWIPVDFTRYWTIITILTNLDSTGLSWPYSIQIWTPLDCQLYSTQIWTPLDCHTNSIQIWTPLDCQTYSGVQKECTNLNLVTLWIAMSESQPILNWSCTGFVFGCTSMCSTSRKISRKSDAALTYFWQKHSTCFSTQFWWNKWQFHFTVWRVNNLLLISDEAPMPGTLLSKVLQPYSHLLHHKDKIFSVCFFKPQILIVLDIFIQCESFGLKFCRGHPRGIWNHIKNLVGIFIS